MNENDHRVLAAIVMLNEIGPAYIDELVYMTDLSQKEVRESVRKLGELGMIRPDDPLQKEL